MKTKIVKLIWQNFLDYIFPKECFICHNEGDYLCPDCFSQLKFIDRFNCFICNRAQSDQGICLKCAADTGISRVVIAAKFRGNVVSQIVEDFKYNYIEDLADILAKIIATQINRQGLAGFMHRRILSPIPLHKKRQAERGFNQAEELAKRIAPLYGCFIEKNLLRRVNDTGQQAKLSRSERFSNIENAFQVNLKLPVPDSVILVDDVLTSGATFIQATKALKQAGVKQVACLAVCHG